MRYSFIALALIITCASNVWSQKTALDSVFNLAITSSSTGDVPRTTALILTAQKMAEAENNQLMLCKIQVVKGKMAIISENNTDGEQIIKQGINMCAACKDTLSLARLYLQSGTLNLKRQAYDSAIATFKLSADYYLMGKDSLGAANAMAKIGNSLEVQGRVKEALRYYLQFFDAVKHKPESTHYLTANIYLAGNYLYLGQWDKALEHNQNVKKAALKLGANYEYAASLRYEAQIFQQQQQHEKAYSALLQYVDFYQDTLMGKIQLDAAEELKAKYEDEKKAAQIALQEAQLSREKLKFWALAAGLFVMVVAGFFLFQLIRKLRQRNEEKEFLIKEIHHRVKNNLQILSSLLHLQSRQIKDDTALSAVREGQNRVDAMGLIHQKLYMGEHVAKVEMKEYLEQFGQNMLDSIGIEDGRIQLEYVLQPTYLDVDTAIPLGLILNELVTNSLKYAFPDGGSGTIRIELWKNEQQHLCLMVSDNGVGKAHALADEKSTSFGTNLVTMLSKKLKGVPEVLPQPQGYATRIVFEQYA
jgi:two-component sensor histidine kinase